MKLNFASVALACVLPIAMYGQDSTAVATTSAAQGQYPNAYTSGSANIIARLKSLKSSFQTSEKKQSLSIALKGFLNDI